MNAKRRERLASRVTRDTFCADTYWRFSLKTKLVKPFFASSARMASACRR